MRKRKNRFAKYRFPFEVLLEAPYSPLRKRENSVLLTVDLTKAVADEAIERGDSIIIAYRMICTLWLWPARIKMT